MRSKLRYLGNRVRVDDNGCWHARAPKDAKGVDSFLAFQQNARLHGCVKL